MKVDIVEAAKHTGLSIYAIRRAAWAKRIPFYRTGKGKYIFDTELLDDAIRNQMLKSMQ